jgi:hypothetical protein
MSLTTPSNTVVAFLDACIVQLPAVTVALNASNSQPLGLEVQQLLDAANRLREQIAGTTQTVATCPTTGNRKKSGFTSKSIMLGDLGMPEKKRTDSIKEEPAEAVVAAVVAPAVIEQAAPVTAAPPAAVANEEQVVKAHSASAASSLVAQGTANAHSAGLEKREELRVDWEEKVEASQTIITEQTEERTKQMQELEKLKALVDAGHIHMDVLHTMCETYHLPFPKVATAGLVSTTTTTITTTEAGATTSSITSSEAVPAAPAPAPEPAAPPAVAAPTAPAVVDPLEGGKSHNLEVKLTDDGRKQSTLTFSGTTSLGVELSQKDAGGVLVSNKDSELLGQHLLNVNGQDVSKLHLKDVMEVFRGCVRPITLIFEEPKKGFFGKKVTKEVHWDGVSPLGIHLANHSSGKGVTVEALADNCSLADESHVGQHLVSVNGIDTTHMNLTDLVKMLRVAEKPIKLGFEQLDNAMIESAVQVRVWGY